MVLARGSASDLDHVRKQRVAQKMKNPGQILHRAHVGFPRLGHTGRT